MLMGRRGQMAVLFGKLLKLLGNLIVVVCDVLARGGHRADSVAFIVASKLSISLRLMSDFVLALLKPFDQFLMRWCRSTGGKWSGVIISESYN
jgi:hypothetical protein